MLVIPKYAYCTQNHKLKRSESEMFRLLFESTDTLKQMISTPAGSLEVANFLKELLEKGNVKAFKSLAIKLNSLLNYVTEFSTNDVFNNANLYVHAEKLWCINFEEPITHSLDYIDGWFCEACTLEILNEYSKKRPDYNHKTLRFKQLVTTHAECSTCGVMAVSKLDKPVTKLLQFNGAHSDYELKSILEDPKECWILRDCFVQAYENGLTTTQLTVLQTFERRLLYISSTKPENS
jgi:hypothetical protein